MQIPVHEFPRPLDAYPARGGSLVDTLIARAQAHAPLACAVAHPCDESSLSSALEAGRLGLLTPLLVGPRHKILEVAQRHGLELGDTEIVEAPHSHAAARVAVELVRAGRAALSAFAYDESMRHFDRALRA